MKHKPKEYPIWRYHKDHEPRLVHTEEDHEKLDDNWFDNPTDAGVKIEVYEGGGQQKVRRVPGYVPGNESISEPKEDDGQDQPTIIIDEDLSKRSVEELRAFLVGHGYPEKKVSKKSKEKLLEMIAR